MSTSTETNLSVYRQSPPTVSYLEGMELQVAQFLDNSLVITSKEMSEKDPQALVELFSTKFEEFKKLSEAARAINQTSKNGMEYSQCLRAAESALESMENIQKNLSEWQKISEPQQNTDIFNEKAVTSDQLISINAQLEEVQGTLKVMQNNIPVGQSILLKMDLENFHQLNEIPKNETYSSELGEFCQPKVSMTQLMNWFGKCIQNSAYTGVSIGYKVDKIYDTSLGQMATVISFKKAPIPEEKERKEELLSLDFKPQSHKSFGDKAIKLGKNIVNIFIPKGVTNTLVIKDHRSLEMIQADQKNTLAIVQASLPDMLKEWNFASDVEIGSRHDLINKYKAPLEYADEADYVVLFHKKVGE